MPGKRERRLGARGASSSGARRRGLVGVNRAGRGQELGAGGEEREPLSWAAGWLTVPMTRRRRREEIADLGRKEKASVM